VVTIADARMIPILTLLIIAVLLRMDL